MFYLELAVCWVEAARSCFCAVVADGCGSCTSFTGESEETRLVNGDRALAALVTLYYSQNNTHSHDHRANEAEQVEQENMHILFHACLLVY